RGAHHGHDLTVRAVPGGVSRGARDAAGGLRVRRRDGGERTAAPGRVGLHEESDAGGVLGAGHFGGGDLPLSVSLVAPPHRPPRANRSNRASPPNGSHTRSLEHFRSSCAPAAWQRPVVAPPTVRAQSRTGPERCPSPRGAEGSPLSGHGR